MLFWMVSFPFSSQMPLRAALTAVLLTMVLLRIVALDDPPLVNRAAAVSRASRLVAAERAVGESERASLVHNAATPP